MPRIDNDMKLDLKDVLIRPKRSTLRSRSEVEVERQYTFRNSKRVWKGVPIMSANMDTTGTLEMAVAFAKQKMTVCLHKHYEPEEVIAFAKKHASDGMLDRIAVSAGTGQKDWEKIKKILSHVPQITMICLDVANGYSEHFITAVKKYRAQYPNHTLIAGNVVTGEMTEELLISGADIVKIGIGPGSVCTTRKVTGVGYPQLSAVIECADAAHGLNGHIMADGGCKNPGDFSKCLGAGADFVMAGGVFAGHDESGGELIEYDGKYFKKFYGMSSATAMKKHAGGVANYRSSEGKSVEIPYRGPVAATILDILGGLRSTCTYVGASKLKELSKRTTFIRVTQQLNPYLDKTKHATKKRDIKKTTTLPNNKPNIPMQRSSWKMSPTACTGDNEYLRRAKEAHYEGTITVNSRMQGIHTFTFEFKNFDVGTYLVSYMLNNESKSIGSFTVTDLLTQRFSWIARANPHYHFSVDNQHGFKVLQTINRDPAVDPAETKLPASPLEKSFSVIVASTQKGAIGKDGKIPWRLKADLKYFKETTSKIPSGCEGKMNAVILGRKTWDSIPSKFRPLPGRLNVVLTRQTAVKKTLEPIENVCTSSSLSSAFDLINARTDIAKIFVIGGGGIYAEALECIQCQTIYQTLVLKDFDGCDTFFPHINPSIYNLDSVSEVKFEKDIPYQFNTYCRISKNNANTSTATTVSKTNLKRKSTGEKAIDEGKAIKKNKTINEAGDSSANPEEYQYLNLIGDIIKSGNRKGDRTGVGTFSKFGKQMRFNLREHFPLLTTKRVFWRGVVEELLWLIKGCTDGKELSKKKVKIWDGNGTREFLDNLGLTNREVGDLGPIYGFQWRHFGASYENCHTDYTGKGVDQLMQVINTIKTKPTDRRIIMSAWNPCDLKKMALPPCHVLAQFYVFNGELSCQMYQRSCDLGLGVPFNIASYSLLTCMIAQVCGLKPGDFVHVLGDAHVYTNHVDALNKQLTRTPRPFPKLKLNSAITDIEKFTFDDIKLTDYKPHKTIKMKMAV